VDVLLVENPKSNNQNPHITLSTTLGTPPAESNTEIKNNLDKITPISLVIDTIEGIHNGSSVEKTLKLTPLRRSKLTPLRRSKLTPLKKC
jgi:2'-5' RNA ligase